jgi:hypothetical protein
MTPEQLKIVRCIRKTCIVMIVMYILGRPTGETEISRILEISSKSARELLDSLERVELVVRTGRCASFELTQKALELGLFDDTGTIYRSSGEIYRTTGNIYRKSLIIINDSDNDLKDSLNSESLTTKRSLTREDHYARDRSGKFFPSRRVVPKTVDKPVDNSVDKSENPSQPFNWDGIPPDLARALREAGLLPNQRVRALAQLEHLTPEYVRAHRQHLVARGKGSHTGLLVKILEGAAPMPEPAQHALTCECEECIRPGYYRGWEAS